MRHYLDEATRDLPEIVPERVLRLAVLLGSIVAWVTDHHLPQGDWRQREARDVDQAIGPFGREFPGSTQLAPVLGELLDVGDLVFANSTGAATRSERS